MRKVIFLVCLAMFTGKMWADNEQDTLKTDRLNYQELNYLGNIYDRTGNPIALSMNQVKTLTDVTLNAHLVRGAFHAMDASTKHNDYSVDIAGLKQIGKFSLSGNISYINSKDADHRWNSTYMVSTLNPFILGDSIASDVTTEEYRLHVGAAYEFSNQFIAGLRMRYTTGSRSDQTDPRPKVDAMHFVITPGVWFRLNEKNGLGLHADFDIYRSNMEHTSINNMANNVFFVMKGMGDHQIFSTADNGGYERDYHGLQFSANIQWNTHLSDAENLLEAGFIHNNEKAKDGGQSYTFKGGDYAATGFRFADRFSFGTEQLKHNIMLEGSVINNKGYCYDQVRSVDTQHANLVYYEVLSKNKLHMSSYLDLSAEYQLNGLRHALPDWMVRAKAGMHYAELTQYELEANKQKWNMGDVLVEGKKYWQISRCRLETSLGVFTRMRLGDRTFSTVRGKLANEYVAPSFEYTTANATGFNARVAVAIPVQLYGSSSWLSIYAQNKNEFYGGNNKYSTTFKGKSRSWINLGVNLTL